MCMLYTIVNLRFVNNKTTIQHNGSLMLTVIACSGFRKIKLIISSFLSHSFFFTLSHASLLSFSHCHAKLDSYLSPHTFTTTIDIVNAKPPPIVLSGRKSESRLVWDLFLYSKLSTLNEFWLSNIIEQLII